MNTRQSCCESNDDAQVSRDQVRDFYSNAAVTTQESLCCPSQYEEKDLSHIPEEVLEISYGCGSPVNRARIREGETFVDLGAGGGIDCFIASKYVGPSGRVYGIDMTDKMLATARKNAAQVAENLGYGNIEFKHGYLEKIPLEDQIADLVTSNCVINLSIDKDEVFREIRRILKPGGRFVIADIISEKEVPGDMRANKELWGECISGALTLSEFLAAARANDFKGITVKQDYLWKIVNGIKFHSYILEGYKFVPPEDTSCCKTLTAIYAGPFETATCDSTVYPVGVPVEVDEETAALLRSFPYAGQFTVIDPDLEAPSESDSCCG